MSTDSVIRGQFEVKHVRGSSFRKGQWEELWETETGFVMTNFVCAIDHCHRQSRIAAHVYLKEDEESDHCYLIPMCSRHKEDRSFDYLSMNSGRWEMTKADTPAVRVELDESFYKCKPMSPEEREISRKLSRQRSVKCLIKDSKGYSECINCLYSLKGIMKSSNKNVDYHI